MHASLAALANPHRTIERVIATRNAAARLKNTPVEPQILDPGAIDGMLPPGAVHQGLAVRCSPLQPVSLAEACAPADGRPVLMLDGVTDPQNVGAAFRAAAAFNARAVLLQDRKSAPLNGVVAKASAGAIDLVAHVRAANLTRAIEELGALGYLTIALDGEAERELADCVGARACAFVLGSEGKGLRPSIAESCAMRARIPISPAIESLNVAVAAAIALYEARRGG